MSAVPRPLAGLPVLVRDLTRADGRVNLHHDSLGPTEPEAPLNGRVLVPDADEVRRLVLAVASLLITLTAVLACLHDIL
jgi:hypothetical protein